MPNPQYGGLGIVLSLIPTLVSCPAWLDQPEALGLALWVTGITQAPLPHQGDNP